MSCLAYPMNWGDRPNIIMQLALLLVLVTMAQAFGLESDGMAAEQNLSLDVYLYDTGKVLVTGYVEDPRVLIFLGPSQFNAIGQNQYQPKYSYDNDTGQINAWTDALTRKNGENWSLSFTSWGFYREWRTVFHLPGDLRLGSINSSSGVNNMIFASNESLLVEARAYHVRNPSIAIEYQQPLGGEPREDMSVKEAFQDLLMIVAFIFILAVVSAFAFVARKRREKLPPGEANQTDLPEARPQDTAAEPAQTATPPDYVSIEADPQADVAEDEMEDKAEDRNGDGAELVGMHPFEEDQKKELKVSSEMATVMKTLTPRERSILETLIRHDGRMTQMEMRYETGSPKSSLSMILISLEKRKLITKREWGRTNVIELSEWFFSKKEQS
jgi:hypothetical protein